MGRAVPWLETALQISGERDGPGVAGSRDRHRPSETDIIFIQAVRAYIRGAGEYKKGLAKAITDPQIGQAL
jgi:hypothetical protein